MQKISIKAVFCSIFFCLIAMTAVPGLQAEAAGAKLSAKKVTIVVGETKTIALKNNTKAVKWSTSRKSVATIKPDGNTVEITGKKVGKATVTAKVGKKKYKCTVTIKKKPVSLSVKKQTVEVGKSFELTLKNGGAAKWSTSNKKIASIKKIGKTKYLVTGRKKGTAKITVKYKKKKYTCTVNVTNPVAKQPESTVPETEASTETETETEKLQISFRERTARPNGNYSFGCVQYIVTDLPAERFSVKAEGPSNGEVEIYKDVTANGLSEAVCIHVTYSAFGLKFGKNQYQVYLDGELVGTWVINVVPRTESEEFDAWKETVKGQCWDDSMSAFEKVNAIGQYICKNYDYDANWDYICFMEGKGGDCYAASNLICHFAADLGLQCMVDHVYGPANEWSSHKCALVKIDGIWWSFDSGTNATAGNRGCMVTELGSVWPRE